MVKKGNDKGKGATVMEKARLADRLMEKHAQLEERTSGTAIASSRVRTEFIIADNFVSQ